MLATPESRRVDDLGLNKQGAFGNWPENLVVLYGIEFLLIENVHLLANGRCAFVRSAITSLLGIGHTKMATLMLSEFAGYRPSEIWAQSQSLRNAWQTMMALPAALFECALLMGRGLTVREVASELHLSVRTIEMRRRTILNRLGLNDLTSLIQLCCALQCFGFSDFGIDFAKRIVPSAKLGQPAPLRARPPIPSRD